MRNKCLGDKQMSEKCVLEDKFNEGQVSKHKKEETVRWDKCAEDKRNGETTLNGMNIMASFKNIINS